ncbi:SDR family oxidoreductase [Marihabitans asiaticum]|uniref:NADP-dependent 3-hydroxy acid dehydrogenase YdfG n=1 Tax=Marihabitans asiaticum TaxID=415218 RepID=A0A560WGD4_9MICO|nr:SDR family NAD(P)-dependent oxidoreductase [Marihabitans asiaticum]TWD16737.1 NADP-dependent 3-hydroxy acid dehydrogenase YdfG [Marihabitans asiaticum]
MTSDAPAITQSSPGVAVVTGASSGIGKATAQRLAADGYDVVLAARRTERIEALAEEIGARAVTCDVTDTEQVAALANAAGPQVALLVNNAGGAFGLETVEEADLAKWRAMYETNVIGTVAVTQALLPALRAGRGTVITITSIAAHGAYEKGAGYCGAKAAEAYVSDALRLELNGEPVRICDIAPGLVKSDEFSLVRFDGDEEKAEAVYAGVEEPLTQEDVAECVAWVAGLPHHVNIDKMTVKPLAQAAPHKLHRTT